MTPPPAPLPAPVPSARPSGLSSDRPPPSASRARGRLRSGPGGRALQAALLLVGVGGAVGCSLFVRSPEVAIADVRVVGLGFAGGTAEVLLAVDNPNRFALEVRAFQYLLEISDPARPERWDTLAMGVTADTVRLPGRSETVVPLEIPFRYNALGTALRAWLQGGEIPYRVEGEVRARGAGIQRDLPFRSRGTLTP
jgi:LEA14-like dessication related protein